MSLGLLRPWGGDSAKDIRISTVVISCLRCATWILFAEIHSNKIELYCRFVGMVENLHSIDYQNSYYRLFCTENKKGYVEKKIHCFGLEKKCFQKVAK